MNSDLVWHQLLITAPVTPAAAAAALTSLAALSGRPRVILEATGTDGQIDWHVGTSRRDRTRVLAALEPHLIGLRTTGDTTKPRIAPDLAAGLRFAGSLVHPLAVDRTESTVRSLLAALARTSHRERLIVQLQLGPRLRPRPLPPPPGGTVDRATVTSDRRKRLEHGFRCTIRVGASANDPARARSLITSVVSALRGLDAPGVRLRASRRSPGSISEARLPWYWSSSLSASDAVALTAWPVGEAPLPGVADGHPKLLPPTRALPRTGRRLGVATTDPARAVAITPADSLRHLHLLGPTGTGKSTVMANLALQDMTAGRGVVVIDPKGDLVAELLERIPPGRQRDVVVLDPLDAEPIGLNPLADDSDPDRAADAVLGVFHALYADSWGPRTHDVLHASLLSLARRGDASLALVPTLLTNPGFRRSVVGRVARQDAMGLGAFWAWFDALSDAERQHVIAPLMNKLRPILLRPGLRGVFGQRRPVFAISDVFQKQRILLVPLSRGRLGQEAAALIGAIAISMVWDAALRRVSQTTPDQRPIVSLFIDEVQEVLRLPGDLSDALATARSAGLALHLAHQALPQLGKPVREAILANARSRITFQLSAADTRAVAATSRGQVEPDDLLSLPTFQAYASLLTNNSAATWVSLTTEPLPPRTVNPDHIRRRSRTTYGRPLSEVEADLLTLADGSRRPDGERIGRTPRAPSSDDHGEETV